MHVHTGKEAGIKKMHLSQCGEETRKMMYLLYELFRGNIEAIEIQEILEATKNHPFSNYELYGNFYLGLYYDALGKVPESIACLGKATRAQKAREDDVMYHMPRLQLILRGQA